MSVLTNDLRVRLRRPSSAELGATPSTATNEEWFDGSEATSLLHFYGRLVPFVDLTRAERRGAMTSLGGCPLVQGCAVDVQPLKAIRSFGWKCSLFWNLRLAPRMPIFGTDAI